MTVTALGRSYLVVSVTPHKYWRATVDGRPEELYVTNVGYQGLWIPDGRHVVALAYSNPLVTLGAIVSICALLALGGLALFVREVR